MLNGQKSLVIKNASRVFHRFNLANTTKKTPQNRSLEELYK